MYCFFTAEENDWRTVHNEVQSISYAYFELGRELGLPPYKLECIKRANRPFEEAIDDMLLLWLKQCHNIREHGLPTWRRLVEAVDSPNGGNNPALAIDIANRHLLPGKLCLIASIPH